MSDTRALLNKIATLRQRLEQARGLARDAGSTLNSLVEETADIHALERGVRAGAGVDRLLDRSLKQIAAEGDANREDPIWPRQLTARARRILQRVQDLLAALRSLADDWPRLTDDAEALHASFRETMAMVESVLRLIQVFPDAPSAQLRLCEGLEALAGMIGERVAALAGLVRRDQREKGITDGTADCLSQLHDGKPGDRQAWRQLADSVQEEVRQGKPLRFHFYSADAPVRFIAGHALNVARIIARLTYHDVDWRGRLHEPILAALVHDVGMLAVPPSILKNAGSLSDEQRRLVEAHCRRGAELVGRLFPDDATVVRAVLEHHERLDGTGYPAGLHERQISPLARLLAVCDVYAALCSPRPQRPAHDTRTALTDTLLRAEQGGLDRFCAERLLHLSFYPVGSVVELADGAVGVVIATHTGVHDLNLPARPILALLTDARGKCLPTPQPQDLALCEGRAIIRSLPFAERRQMLGNRYPEYV